MLTSISLLTSAPTSCSSNPGTNAPDPTIISYPVAEPPSKGSPL